MAADFGLRQYSVRFMTDRTPDMGSEPSRLAGTAYWLLLLVACSIAFFIGRGPVPPPAPVPSDTAKPPPEAGQARGRELARTLCSSCHLTPDPAVATRDRWAFTILPEKAALLGLAESASPVGRTNGMPGQPVVSQTDWRALSNYYLASAPDDHPGAYAPTSGLSPATGFKPVPLQHPDATRMSAVVIDPAGGTVFLGNADLPGLEILSPQGAVLAARKFPQPILSIAAGREALFVTTGDLNRRSRSAPGSLIRIGKPGSTLPAQQTLFGNLLHPSTVALADLNHDQRTDLLVGHAGGMDLHLNHPEGFKSQSIATRSATVALAAAGARVYRLGGFGHAEITSHRLETTGQLSTQSVREFHPAWHLTDLALADLNGDGLIDLIVSNGDDERSLRAAGPDVPYHGIRIYLAQRDGGFSEAFFYPLSRARRVAARDFDGDGDIDLAAIGCSTDRHGVERNGAVYLENLGDLKFSAMALPESGSARWYDLAVGDLDGDGDPDIVLAALHPGARRAPEALLKRWEQTPMTCLFLLNQVIP